MFAWKQDQSPSGPYFIIKHDDGALVKCNCDPCTSWMIGAFCSCGCGEGDGCLGAWVRLNNQTITHVGVPICAIDPAGVPSGPLVGSKFNGIRYTTEAAPFDGSVSVKFYLISPTQDRSLIASWSGECFNGIPCIVGEGNKWDYEQPWNGLVFDEVVLSVEGCYAIDAVITFTSNDEPTPDEPTPVVSVVEFRYAMQAMPILAVDDTLPGTVVIYDSRYQEDCSHAPGRYRLQIMPIFGPYASR